MIIKINDKLDGKERRRQVQVQQVLYAASICDGVKQRMKVFLGYSSRGIRNMINRNPELHHLKGTKCVSKSVFYKESLKRWE